MLVNLRVEYSYNGALKVLFEAILRQKQTKNLKIGQKLLFFGGKI